MKYGFGVDLGGTTVKIAYFDEQGTMLAKWEIPTVLADGGKQILPDIAASIRQFIEQKSIDPADIIGVGMGVPGPVNSKGVVNKCVNLGWGVFNIAEDLGNLVGFPVKAGNDANVAALGETLRSPFLASGAVPSPLALHLRRALLCLGCHRQGCNKRPCT